MLSRIRLQNDDINCLCLAYNAATGAKIILTWNMQFNYPWMNLAWVTGGRAHGATQKSLWLVSARGLSEPLALQKEHQCHTDCVCVCFMDVGKLVSDVCKQLHLQMCWGSILDPAAEKKPSITFSQRNVLLTGRPHYRHVTISQNR